LLLLLLHTQHQQQHLLNVQHVEAESAGAFISSSGRVLALSGFLHERDSCLLPCIRSSGIPAVRIPA
jgi:hypothetical protein